MIRIKNKNQLIRNGEGRLRRNARRIALQSLEAALNAVDPYKILKSRISMKDSIIAVDGYSFDLKRYKRVYMIGGGKASGQMADALSRALDRRITRGIVNVPHGSERTIGTIELHGASHPIPDEAGVKGTTEMLKIAEEAGENDLIICLISGGGSSLMPLPHDGISILDKRKITTALLRSGATINEINTVRKHISHFKGGWLAKEAFPATILNLILSDVVGDPLNFIASGPTIPDPTTFSDTIALLRKYQLWSAAPKTIKKVLVNGTKGLIPETPKPGDKAFKNVYNVVIGNNRSASAAAHEYLKSVGLNSLMLTSSLEGEARDVGVVLASLAREIVTSGNPMPRPAGIVAGGETTVTVTGGGKGGRNQEMALAATSKLSGTDGVILACLSTDGVDGPTNAAGAITDSETLARATRMGLSPESHLTGNDSYTFFSKLGDLILTGPTGTNVNDISVLVVL
jgi:glycerate 2-kinase